MRANAAEIDPKRITHVMHGTTVATNAMLTGNGARVGLVTTDGYRQVLQIARSFVPGGLGGWVIYEPSAPLAPLELTVEIPERVGADGSVVRSLEEAPTREALAKLGDAGIEALTVSLINSFENPVTSSACASSPARCSPMCPCRSRQMSFPRCRNTSGR